MQLAVGIPTLTETEYLDLAMALPNEKIEDFENFVRPLYRSQVEATPGHDRWLTKIFLQDPLVFGGLALQIATTVRVLSQYISGIEPELLLDKEEANRLLLGIVEVELADRMSDMSTLERHLEGPVEEYAYSRFRVMAYAARMLNMHDRLSEAVSDLPQDDKLRFEGAFRKYLAVLACKLEEVSEGLEKAGVPGITPQSFDTYYREVFSPVQRKAEEATADFLSRKVERNLEKILLPRA
jgi:hypothetical protein